MPGPPVPAFPPIAYVRLTGLTVERAGIGTKAEPITHLTFLQRQVKFFDELDQTLRILLALDLLA